AALPGVDAVHPLPAAGDGGGRWRLDVAGGADPRGDVFRAAVEQGWTLVELAEERASLEDVFVRLIAGDTAAEAEGEAELEPEAETEPEPEAEPEAAHELADEADEAEAEDEADDEEETT
ncbi:MAG TPA: hypothetical protein VKU40_16880, partial [Thermoanaerobaculia bacterium]|nr:hypothetical protein [Thermoanaerobaculia bacterium]